MRHQNIGHVTEINEQGVFHLVDSYTVMQPYDPPKGTVCVVVNKMDKKGSTNEDSLTMAGIQWSGKCLV